MNSPKSAPLKNSETVETWNDPVVSEVRDARHRLAARYDNDLCKVAEDLMQRQLVHGSRLKTREPLAGGS
jgi:hypothetical protein